MKGRHRELGRAVCGHRDRAAQRGQGGQSAAHLLSGPPGEGDGQELLGRAFLGDGLMDDPMGQRPRLAGPGSRDDHERRLGGRGGRGSLLVIQAVQQHRR